MQLPTLEYELLTADGRPGWIGEWFAHENDDSMRPAGESVKKQYIDETRIFIRYTHCVKMIIVNTHLSHAAHRIRMVSPNAGLSNFEAN